MQAQALQTGMTAALAARWGRTFACGSRRPPRFPPNHPVIVDRGSVIPATFWNALARSAFVQPRARMASLIFVMSRRPASCSPTRSRLRSFEALPSRTREVRNRGEPVLRPFFLWALTWLRPLGQVPYHAPAPFLEVPPSQVLPRPPAQLLPAAGERGKACIMVIF